jgi:hypothetical protein
MITCSNIGYNGRLANQMFQFASVLGMGRKLGYDVKFPSENFIQGNPHDYNGGKLRECFDIPDSYFESNSIISPQIKYVYNEEFFTYNENFLSFPDDIDIRGYYQTEKYFIAIREELLSCFIFKKEIIDSCNIEIDSNSVSIHVRRGDYVNYPNQHPTQSLEYYKKALEIIGKNKVYVFSDDINWCKENMDWKEYDMIFLEIDNPYHSLYLMSKCSDNIIANSSFSWWAAWLNPSPNKKVVAPKIWFGPGIPKDTSDVCSHLWIKI